MKKETPISTIEWLGRNQALFFALLEAAHGGYAAMTSKLSELCPKISSREAPVSAILAAMEIHENPEKFDWQQLYQDLTGPEDNEDSIFRVHNADPRAWRAINEDFSSRFTGTDGVSSNDILLEWYETRDSESARPWRHHSGEYSKIEWQIPAIPKDYALAGYFVVAGTHHYKASMDDFLNPGIRWISLKPDPDNPYDECAISVMGFLRRGEETAYHHIGYVPRSLAATLSEGNLLENVTPLAYKFEQKPDQLYFSVALVCTHISPEKLTGLRAIR
jgi:hypothetical protein